MHASVLTQQFTFLCASRDLLRVRVSASTLVRYTPQWLRQLQTLLNPFQEYHNLCLLHRTRPPHIRSTTAACHTASRGYPPSRPCTCLAMRS